MLWYSLLEESLVIWRLSSSLQGTAEWDTNRKVFGRIHTLYTLIPSFQEGFIHSCPANLPRCGAQILTRKEYYIYCGTKPNLHLCILWINGYVSVLTGTIKYEALTYLRPFCDYKLSSFNRAYTAIIAISGANHVRVQTGRGCTPTIL